MKEPLWPADQEFWTVVCANPSRHFLRDIYASGFADFADTSRIMALSAAALRKAIMSPLKIFLQIASVKCNNR